MESRPSQPTLRLRLAFAARDLGEAQPRLLRVRPQDGDRAGFGVEHERAAAEADGAVDNGASLLTPEPKDALLAPRHVVVGAARGEREEQQNEQSIAHGGVGHRSFATGQDHTHK